MGDSELYDIMLRTRINGQQGAIWRWNVPKETKVRDLLPEDFDSDNHPFRLNVSPPLVDIDDTLEELGNRMISPVVEIAGMNKLLSLFPVPAVVPPETDSNGDTSSVSEDSQDPDYLYTGGGGRKGKSKRRKSARRVYVLTGWSSRNDLCSRL